MTSQVELWIPYIVPFFLIAAGTLLLLFRKAIVRLQVAMAIEYIGLTKHPTKIERLLSIVCISFSVIAILMGIAMAYNVLSDA